MHESSDNLFKVTDAWLFSSSCHFFFEATLIKKIYQKTFEKKNKEPNYTSKYKVFIPTMFHWILSGCCQPPIQVGVKLVSSLCWVGVKVSYPKKSVFYYLIFVLILRFSGESLNGCGRNFWNFYRKFFRNSSRYFFRIFPIIHYKNPSENPFDFFVGFL